MGASERPASLAHRRFGLGWAKRRRRALLVMTAVVAVVAFAFTSADVRWRARLLYARSHGEYREIPFFAFVKWLRPHSIVNLFPLLESGNVRATIRNELTDDATAEQGLQLFAYNCARCHGEKGAGAVGPSLVGSIARNSDWNFFATVKWGRPGTLMLPQPLTDREIWATLTFVRRLLHEPGTSGGAHAKHPTVNVIASTIAESSEKSDEWLTYDGSYSGHRHSRLSQISPKNVRDLALAWTEQFRGTSDHVTNDLLQGSPLVAGSTLFVPGPPGTVEALDARTGEKIWEFVRPNPTDLALCCGTGHRGLALMGDTLFAVTLDAHLLAMDATTGHQKWDTEVAKVSDNYSLTSAPLAIGDKIVTGVAGGDFGAPGFLAAYSASDGHRLWQFNTIPGPGEPGHETWAGDSWKTGGAGTWVTGAYDKDLDLLYWGVGNAAPVYHSEVREGDNLYSMSAIAVELSTGKLRWHFQFTPGDDHDWDSANQPVIADIDWQGVRTPALLWANRNGFFYALDRRTGKFLFAKPFVKQTWTTGIDPSGRPISNSAVKATEKGTLTWPWAGGATNWQPPSYDITRSLVFIPAIDAAGLFFSSGSPRVDHRQIFEGGAALRNNDQPVKVSVEALDAATGESRWEAVLGSGLDVPRSIGGVLSTDSGLVFVGFGSQFLALDSDTGKELWRVNLGGTIKAGPMAFAIEGQEYIAVMGGRALFVFSLSPNALPARQLSP